MTYPSVAGGSAAKVAIAYELTWTADKLLDLLGGQATEITLEPGHNEGLGIEFTLLRHDRAKEFHSVKRQAPGSKGVWTPAVLTEEHGPASRSILSDMLNHVQAGDNHRSVFVSQDGVRFLREAAARLSVGSSAEDRGIELSVEQQDAVQRYVVPRVLGNDPTVAEDKLRRCEFKAIDHDELVRFVEHRISGLIRNRDGSRTDATDARLRLEEFAWQRMRRTMRDGDLHDALESWGLSAFALSESAEVLAAIRDRNEAFRAQIDDTLINQEEIPRCQSGAIAEEIIAGGPSVLLEGSAGDGKSSLLAQVARRFETERIPHLMLSMNEIDGILTSLELGRRIGLPTSPTTVLGELSTTGRTVLCVDQLDDLSFAKGRNQQGRGMLEQLIREAAHYPNLRVLCACRTFDLEVDEGLSKLVAGDSPSMERVEIDLLRIDEVHNALSAAEVDGTGLSTQQIEVLRKPLHLKLFLQPGTGRESFSEGQSLFDRYWKEKRRRVDALTAPGVFVQTVLRLSDVMDQRESLTAPMFELVDTTGGLEALASEGVVELSETDARFFHDSYFAYSFVRSFFARGVSITDWLLAREQVFFRRYLTREILAFLRTQETDEARYLGVLSDLLCDDRIRIHIKTSVLGWLNTLQDPTPGEWRLIEELEPELGDHIWRTVANSVAWFDRLDQMGLWEFWLGGDDELTDRAVMLMSRTDVVNARAGRVVHLVAQKRTNSDAWRRRIPQFVLQGLQLRDESFQALLLELIADGTLDEPESGFLESGLDFWMLLHALNDAAPESAARALGSWLDRAIAMADKLDSDDPFGPSSPLVHYDSVFVETISDCAGQAPARFIRELLSRFVILDQRVPHFGLWAPEPFSEPDRRLRQELIRTMRGLAFDDPGLLDDIVTEVTGESFPSTKWTASVILDAWTANPAHYAKRIVKTLLDRVDSWLTAEDADSIGRIDAYGDVCQRAVIAAAPYCSSPNFAEVERAILSSRYEWEEQSGYVGSTQLRFLLSLPEDRLSSTARRRKAELQGRYPSATAIEPPPPLDGALRAAFALSPAAVAEAPPTTDADWLALMRKHPSREPTFLPDGRFVGGSVELARDLEAATRDAPEHYSRLPNQMDESIATIYFEAILRGLTRDAGGHTRRADPVAVGRALMRIQNLDVPVRGAELAQAIAAIGHQKLPHDILAMLRGIALSDPDPESDDWPTRWSSPVDQAVNSARGVAAEATARLLRQDPGRWTLLRPMTERLVYDKVLAVRAVAVQCLSAILHSNTNEAIELFERLVEGADSILGTPFVESFVHEAIFRDYARLRPHLRATLMSTSPQAVAVAARQITVASLFANTAEAPEDVNEALRQSPAARAAVAAVFARNLAHEEVTRECEAQLTRLFDDEDLGVRNSAADCWASLSAVQIARRGRLIRAYAQSKAYADRHNITLFHRLERVDEALPVAVLELAERIIYEHRSVLDDTGFANGAAHLNLASVLLQLHEQIHDLARRRRVLDLIDEMIRLGIYGVNETLQKRIDTPLRLLA